MNTNAQLPELATAALIRVIAASIGDAVMSINLTPLEVARNDQMIMAAGRVGCPSGGWSRHAG